MGTLTMTPADVLEYQRELVRTHDYLPVGRMQKISIGYNAGYQPPPADPYIQKFGRMIELRDRFLPLAQSRDRSQLLVTAPLPIENGRVVLPDLPDPTWKPEEWSNDEVTGVSARDAAKDQVRMVPQRLEDRSSERLQGTNMLVFQPVIRLAFQPELENRLQSTAWTAECRPDSSGKGTALLVDMKTGECFFFGGRFEFSGGRG
ncbi:MAG: hypothetical protein ACRER4_01865 [Steroidobacteraceae bacterium]